MTPQENVDQITTQLVDGLRATGVPLADISRHCDMSYKSLYQFCERLLKTGGSLNNVAEIANYLKLKLVLIPLSPDSAGVLPVETTPTQLDQ